MGRHTIRGIDLIVGYKRCLPEGSVRRRTMDTMLNKAHKKGLMPHRATEVMEEIKKRMKEDFKETSFQVQSRLDEDFAQLRQAGRTHADFRSLFGQKVDEMEEKDCAPDSSKLCRAYLTKIDDRLREGVLYRDWDLDGNGIHRQPRT